MVNKPKLIISGDILFLCIMCKGMLIIKTAIIVSQVVTDLSNTYLLPTIMLSYDYNNIILLDQAS